METGKISKKKIPYNIVIWRVVSKSIGDGAVFVPIGTYLAVFPPRFVESKISAKECSNDGPSEDGYGIRPHKLPHKRHRAVLQHADDVLSHQIQILLAHFRHLILNFSRVVDDHECCLQFLWLFVELIVLVHGIELLKQCFASCTRKTINIRINYGIINN